MLGDEESSGAGGGKPGTGEAGRAEFADRHLKISVRLAGRARSIFPVREVKHGEQE